MKSLLKILIAVFAVCLIAPAFSAVENVKVGGDIAVWGVMRENFETAGKEGYEDRFFTGFSQVRVYVSADLSQNVSAMVRLINERIWGNYDLEYGDTESILLDLAYLKVSDFLTPGLSLIIGRQEIELGEGLLVGSRYRNVPDGYPVLTALKDLGLQKAFDGVKIDYSAPNAPVSLTAFYTQIDDASPDEKLFGVDFGFGVADVAKIDVYYVGNMYSTNGDIHNAGLRIVSGIPVVNGLTVKLEGAKQFTDSTGWALIAGIKYAPETNLKPWIKANYVRYSDDWTHLYSSNLATRIGPLFYALYGPGTGIEEGNIQAYNLGFGISPTEKWNLSLDGYYLDTLGTGGELGYDVSLGIEYKHTEDLTFGLTGGMIFGGSWDPKPWQILGFAKLVF